MLIRTEVYTKYKQGQRIDMLKTIALHDIIK